MTTRHKHEAAGRATRACLGFACVVLAPAALASEEGPSLSLSAAYTGDLRRNSSGGLAVGSAYADAMDLGLVWVADGLFSSARMTTSLSVMYLGGDDFSGQYAGDWQGVNNIEAANGWKLYESWVEFGFGESRNTLRAGVLDLNAEFDTPATSGLFVASPFGIGTDLSQTGARGPACWPDTGLGLRVAGQFNDSLAWRAGAYDGAPGTEGNDFTSMDVSRGDGALLIGEIEYVSERVHKLALGVWNYTASFEPVSAPVLADTREQHGNRGVYALVDLRVGGLGRVDLDAAMRAGTAAARFNVFDRYTGAVLTASHLWESRPGDALGLGVAQARTGNDFRSLMTFTGQPAAASETTVELVYRAELAPWLSLLPNLQFVKNPGADPVVDDAWIAGLRFEITRDRTWQLLARRNIPADDSYARRTVNP